MYDVPQVMVDARFLHRMVGYQDIEHDPHVEGYIPEQTISSARPDITWPIDRHWNMFHSVRVDEELDLDLIETIAERNPNGGSESNF